jgi:hypothetical protein
LDFLFGFNITPLSSHELTEKAENKLDKKVLNLILGG